MTVKAFIRPLAVLIVLVATVAGILAYSIARRGLSTRTEPTRFEEFMARTMRRLATPSEVRAMSNPVERTPGVVDEGAGALRRATRELGARTLHQASAAAHGRRDRSHGAVESEDRRTVA